MAISAAAISGDESTWRSAGYPAFAALHAGDDLVITGGSGSASRWVSGTSGTLSGTDITHSSAPVRWACDRRGTKRTKPNTSGTGFSLVLNLGADAPDIDGILLWGLNGVVADGANNMTVTVEAADNAAFSTNLGTVATWTVTSETRTLRLGEWDLDGSTWSGGGSSDRLSGVQYIRITFSRSTSFTPEVGEVWLLRRRQLWKHPLMGHDPIRERSHVVDTGPSYDRTRYVDQRGQYILDGEWVTESSTHVTLLRNLWRDMEEGTRRFLWYPDPNADDGEAYIMDLDSAELHMPPSIGENVRDVGWLMASEQRPFYAREVA